MSVLRGPLPTRILGGATVAYSLAIIVRPEWLARPCGLVPPGIPAPTPLRATIRAIGARDVASGLAMVLAPAGRPLQVAAAVRVAADWSDAVVFGTAPGTPARKARIVGFAAGWGTLCAVAGALVGRDR